MTDEMTRLQTALREIATQATQAIDTRCGGEILRQIEVTARTALATSPSVTSDRQHLLDAAPLMLEALEAAEEVAHLQRPFVDGINRGSTASQEVIQEASDRLGAAQRRWWGLRQRALEAVRRPARRAGGEQGTGTGGGIDGNLD